MARNMDQVTSELGDMKLHDTLQGVLNNMQFNVCLAKYEDSISNQSKKQNKQNIVYKLSDQKYAISNFTIDEGCIYKKGKYFAFEVINTHGGTSNCSCTTDPCCRHSQVVSGMLFKGVEIPILPSCLDGLWNVRSTSGRKTFLCTRANDTATVTYFIPRDKNPYVECHRCSRDSPHCVHYSLVQAYLRGEHVPAPVDPPIPPPSEILSPDFMPSNEEDICHSKKPIQIPLPLADKTRFTANLMNGYYEKKEHFVPEYDPDLVCSCPKENPFFSDDPVEYNYVVPRRSPYLVLPTLGRYVKLYYRPTVSKSGKCDCKQYFDGRSDFLINIDNSYLIRIDMLMSVCTMQQFSTATVFGYVISNT